MRPLLHLPALRLDALLLAGLLATTLLLVAGASGNPSAEPQVCIRALVTGPEVFPIPGTNVQLVALDEDDEPLGDPRVALADPDGRVEFCGVGLGRFLVGAQITGFVDTRIGPISVTEENHRVEEIFELWIVLNPTVVF